MEPSHIGHYREYLPRGLSQPKNGRFLEVPGNSSCGTTKSQNKNPVKDRLKKIDTVDSGGFRPSEKGGQLVALSSVICILQLLFVVFVYFSVDRERVSLLLQI